MSYPLPEAYADNPAEICLRHATHDIIPETEKEVCVPFGKVPRYITSIQIGLLD